MHFLSNFSLRNRALIALVTIVVGVFGFISLNSLKQELIPSVTLPQVVVVTAYPGAAPEVVNEDVSTPIETAIQGVAGLDTTSATSSANSSMVSASFVYGTDLVTAEQKVQLAINRLSSQLPTGVDPQVITGSLDDLPVIQIAVTSDLDQNALSAALNGSTLADIQALDGVREASLQGDVGQRITITPDAAALAASGLSTQSITNALDANGMLLPAGSITENDLTMTVQSGARITTTDEIAALPLLGGSAPVTLGSVATVQVTDNPVTSISRVNGQPALTIAVTKTPDGNTVDVSNAVQDLIPQLQSTIGNNTTFTVVFDQAPFIQQSIESLATEGVLGLLFAVIVILIFLASFRSTLVTAISIPASVLITFIGMQAANYSLNIITLGALTIAIGRVVDDAIVVIENIKRHLALEENRLLAIRTAVREVATAITASTITTVAVFLPLALVGDITGELFRPFALTVTIALAASLFVALTIVPVLAYWFLGKKTDRKAAAAASAAVVEPASPLVRACLCVGRAGLCVGRACRDPQPRLRRVSQPLPGRRRGSCGHPSRAEDRDIHRPCRRARPPHLAAEGLPAGHSLDPQATGRHLARRGADPRRHRRAGAEHEDQLHRDSGQNTLSVSQSLPLGSSLDAKDAAAHTVENALMAIPGIQTVQVSIGSAGGGTLQSAFGGGGDVSYSLTTDPAVDQQALQSTVRDDLDGLDGVGDLEVSASGSGFGSSSIDIDITATDQADLTTASDALLKAVSGLNVTSTATSNLSETQPYIAVTVDRAKAAAVGLSEMAVGGIVSQAMQPTTVGSAVIDQKTLSIYIDNASAPTTVDELRALPHPDGNRTRAPLGARLG